MRFGPVTFGTTGCHSSTPDAHYPEPLIFTTTKDDRVGPVHARHNFGANLKESAETKAVDYIYLTRKLMD